MKSVVALFRTLLGSEYHLYCSPTDTFGAIVSRLAAEQHLPTTSTLLYKGRQLDPDDEFSSIRYTAGDAIFVQTAERERIGARDDGRRPADDASDTDTDTDPSDDDSDISGFDALVESIMDLGFAKDDCESALRSTNFDPDAAVTQLLLRNADGTLPMLQLPPEMQPIFDRLTKEQQLQVAEIQRTTHAEIGFVLQVYEACDYSRETTINCLSAG
jgi:hypothetical protein